jgi:hypothetical protein
MSIHQFELLALHQLGETGRGRIWHPMIGNHIDIRQVHVPALHQPDEAEKALHEIKSMGFIHILFTRLLKHAKQTDSSSFGIKATMPQ